MQHEREPSLPTFRPGLRNVGAFPKRSLRRWVEEEDKVLGKGRASEGRNALGLSHQEDSPGLFVREDNLLLCSPSAVRGLLCYLGSVTLTEARVISI